MSKHFFPNNEPSTVSDFLRCSRRPVFVNDDENYQYSSLGTLLLCQYKDRYFGIIPKHVVEGFPIDSLCVPYFQGSSNFLDYIAHYTAHAGDSDDTDRFDIVVYELDDDSISPGCFMKDLPYSIQGTSFRWKPNDNGHLLVRGFPSQINSVDFESKTLKEQAVVLQANYVSPATMANCHKLSFHPFEGGQVELNSLDGLSGSPVIWVSPSNPKQHALAGILLRASYSSRTGHFVEVNWLMHLLDKCIAPDG